MSIPLGSMGIGKSYLVREVAKELNMYVVEINLAQHEPTDMGYADARWRQYESAKA